MLTIFKSIVCICSGKSLGQLFGISLKYFSFLKTFNSEFLDIEVWFAVFIYCGLLIKIMNCQKLRTKNWVDMNDSVLGTNNTNCQIKF